MEIIPFIVLEKRKITDDVIYSEKKLKDINEGERIYILDLDGTEKNKPNLNLYQKLSSSYDLWIDGGPRNFGDVVDIFMAGATSVTIRKKLCPLLKISNIRDVSENKIYAHIDFEDYNIHNDVLDSDFDGLVSFNSREKIEWNTEYSDYINKTKDKIYFYEKGAKNRLFWERLGVRGLIVDARKIKEFKDGF